MSGFANTGAPEDEGQYLQSVFLPAKAFGGPGLFGLDPASHMDEKHLLATQESADRLFKEWGRHWDLSKSVLLEKSPPNLVRTRFLQKLFPSSYFVALLRHPVAVALATQQWRKRRKWSIPGLLEHSLKCYERFFSDAKHLNHVFVLRYEDLVRSPHAQIGRLLAWAGLEAHEFGIPVRNDNEKYFSAWSDRRADLLGGTSAAQVAQLESGLNLYGYSLNEPMVTTQGIKV